LIATLASNAGAARSRPLSIAKKRAAAGCCRRRLFSLGDPSTFEPAKFSAAAIRRTVELRCQSIFFYARRRSSDAIISARPASNFICHARPCGTLVLIHSHTFPCIPISGALYFIGVARRNLQPIALGAPLDDGKKISEPYGQVRRVSCAYAPADAEHESGKAWRKTRTDFSAGAEIRERYEQDRCEPAAAYRPDSQSAGVILFRRCEW